MGLYLASWFTRSVPQIEARNGIVANFREAEENDRPSWVSWIANETSRLVSKTKNSYSLQKNYGYFLDFFQNRCPPESIVTPFPTWKVNFHIITNRDVAIEFFQHHRQSDFFSIDNTGYKNFFDSMMKFVFPDLGIQPNDIIFTCETKYTEEYRQLLGACMNEQFINESKIIFDEIVDTTLLRWEEMAKEGPINITLETQKFMTQIIGRLFLGYTGSCDALAVATDLIFSRFGKNSLSNNPQGALELKAAVEEITSVIQYVLGRDETSSFIKAMESRGYTNAQKCAMIIMLFFGGQGTTASALNYILLKCSQETSLQESLLANKISVRDLMAEGLRMLAPNSFIGRIANKDLVLTIRNVSNEMFENRYFISKGDRVLAAPSVMGRDSSLAPGVDLQVFDPYRWKECELQDDLYRLSWFPFGYGVHGCPGSRIAQGAMSVFLDKILTKFVLSTNLQGEPRQKYTDGYQEGLLIQLTPR